MSFVLILVLVEIHFDMLSDRKKNHDFVVYAILSQIQELEASSLKAYFIFSVTGFDVIHDRYLQLRIKSNGM